MKYSESLKKNRDFKLVYRTGTSYANRYLVMYVRENQLEKNRIGVSVSKKVGNSVVRHRLCRLMRESYRLHEEIFHRGLDIVVVARVNAKGRTFREIESAFLHLGRLHKIVERNQDENNINQIN
jgi:ribonuclease P protein component